MKTFIVKCTGGIKREIQIKPLMTVQAIIDETADILINDYRCIIHEGKILQRDHIICGLPDNSKLLLRGRIPYISYCRLSSGKQNDLYSFAHQREMISNYIIPLGGVIVYSFQEIATGKQMDIKTRPIFDRAVKLCKETGYILVVSKTDRLCRNTRSIIDLERLGIKYEIAELGIDQSRFMLMITASVAEEEARLISDRTRRALREVKRTANKVGRPPINNHEEHRRAFLQTNIECIRACKTYKNAHPGATLMDAYRSLTIVRPNGKPYSYDMVYRIFGKQWDREEIIADVQSYLNLVYIGFANENWHADLDYRIPIYDDQYTIIPERDPDIWLRYMREQPIIWVHKLSDIPLCSKIQLQMSKTTVIADDYPSVYYMAAHCYLGSELSISRALVAGKHPDIIKDDNRRGVINLAHCLRSSGLTIASIASNVSLTSSQVNHLLSTTFAEVDHVRIISAFLKLKDE